MTETGMPEKHLYLAFDDWHSGYSIRKVSLSSGPSKSAELQPLPPVFMRMEAPRGFPGLFTSAFGPKIIMMHSCEDDDDQRVPTLDVHDLTITYRLQENTPAMPIYIPIGEDRLFALDIGSFEVLHKPPCTRQPWEWQGLTRHPFRIWELSSYCLHPDGCILFSTKGNGTFSFEDYLWEKCGDWGFPFSGRGHYDSILKGFVGLSKDGYLYRCTINSTMTAFDSVKTLTPKSFDFKGPEGNQADNKQLVSATLVHMCPGKFCIVECVSIGERMTDEELDHELRRVVPPGADQFHYMGGGPQAGRFMYCLKTFSLSHDTKGDLKLEDPKLYCYSLPHEARVGSIHKDPVAFWL